MSTQVEHPAYRNEQDKMRREARLLYRMEVLYKITSETKVFQLKNLLPAEFMRVRENMFSAGLVHKDPDVHGHGFVVAPWDIISCEYWTQEKFIE